MPEALPDFNLREQLVRIDNLREEALKFSTETHKLSSQAAKLERDRALSPILVVIVMMGSVGGFVAGVLALINFIAAIHSAPHS